MSFLYPNVFFMMLLPLVVLIFLVMTNKQTLEKYFSKESLEALRVGGRTLGKNTRNGLLFFTMVLFITALARPVIEKKQIDVKQNLIPVVIALDVSKSMKAEDIYPNRATLGKKKLKNIIKQAKNATIGVVLFAKDSYVLSPVTEDFVSLNYIVDNLDINLDLANGSNIFSVLLATEHMLKDFKVKNLIILSDGGNKTNYEKELEFAKENNIAVYSIGLGTKNGSPIPLENKKDGYQTNKDGKIVIVKLNDSIKDLCVNSGGGFIEYSLNKNDVDAIINRINNQSKKEELKTKQVKIYTELFYYPLALGIFILFIALSSAPSMKLKLKSKNSSLLLFFILFLDPNGLQAFEFPFEKIEKAKNYYENKDYEKAAQKYRELGLTPQTLYNLGNALYKQKKYDEAIKAYSQIVTTNEDFEFKKLHNLGNSYVMKNQLKKAKELYEKALKIKDDKYTKENLELIKKELEKQNKQNKQQKNEQENKEKNKNEKNKNESKKKQKDNQKNKNTQNQQGKKQEKKEDKKEEKKNKKQDAISDQEERKWMKLLENEKTPLLMRKIPNNNLKGDTGESNQNEPW